MKNNKQIKQVIASVVGAKVGDRVRFNRGQLVAFTKAYEMVIAYGRPASIKASEVK